MNAPDQLAEFVHDQITELSAAGDDLANQGKYDAALEKYQQAMELLPEPREHWDAHFWLLAAIGDAYFLQGEYASANEAFQQALFQHEAALGNPFIHLRAGQCCFELGNLQRAGDELMRAYLADPEVFEGDDPKYLEYLSSIALDIKKPGHSSN